MSTIHGKNKEKIKKNQENSRKPGKNLESLIQIRTNLVIPKPDQEKSGKPRKQGTPEQKQGKNQEGLGKIKEARKNPGFPKPDQEKSGKPGKQGKPKQKQRKIKKS